jgi:hypothetical protein
VEHLEHSLAQGMGERAQCPWIADFPVGEQAASRWPGMRHGNHKYSFAKIYL